MEVSAANQTASLEEAERGKLGEEVALAEGASQGEEASQEGVQSQVEEKPASGRLHPRQWVPSWLLLDWATQEA